MSQRLQRPGGSGTRYGTPSRQKGKGLFQPSERGRVYPAIERAPPTVSLHSASSGLTVQERGKGSVQHPVVRKGQGSQVAPAVRCRDQRGTPNRQPSERPQRPDGAIAQNSIRAPSARRCNRLDHGAFIGNVWEWMKSFFHIGIVSPIFPQLNSVVCVGFSVWASNFTVSVLSS